MKRLKLVVEKRKLVGKKAKKLRKEGILPTNIYGKGIKSISVQLKTKEFEKAYKEARETSLIDVELEGKIIPALIHNVQRAPLSRDFVHADFYKVDLTQKVKAMVTVVAMGEAKAVLDKVGLLLQPLSQVEIEALPTDLPEKIEVNVSALATLGQQITVGELTVPNGVTILTDKVQIVFKVGELVSKEAALQAEQEKAAAEAAKAATAEGAVPAEGQAPAAEVKPAKEETKPAAEAGKPTPEAAKPQK